MGTAKGVAVGLSAVGEGVFCELEELAVLRSPLWRVMNVGLFVVLVGLAGRSTVCMENSAGFVVDGAEIVEVMCLGLVRPALAAVS